MRMRVAASVALTAAVSTVLAGCAFVTPQQTARSYTPSDGVNGRVGDVRIRNVFLVSEDGEDGSLIGVLTNAADSVRVVTLQYKTAEGLQSTEVTVPAAGLVSLRPASGTAPSTEVTTTEDDVTLSGIDATPGGLFPVGFSVGSADPVSLQVPVLLPEFSDYRTLTPSPTPTPTRTRRLTPPSDTAETDAPEASASPTDSAEAGSTETSEPTDSPTP